MHTVYFRISFQLIIIVQNLPCIFVKENSASLYGLLIPLSLVQWLESTNKNNRLWLANNVSWNSSSFFSVLFPIPRVITDHKLAVKQDEYLSRTCLFTHLKMFTLYQVFSSHQSPAKIIDYIYLFVFHPFWDFSHIWNNTYWRWSTTNLCTQRHSSESSLSCLSWHGTLVLKDLQLPLLKEQ